MTNQQYGRLMLRLPADAKAWIEAQAERNGSSQNSEIIRCVRDRMQAVAADRQEVSGR